VQVPGSGRFHPKTWVRFALTDALLERLGHPLDCDPAFKIGSSEVNNIGATSQVAAILRAQCKNVTK
jgi:hypothetical protein